MLMSVNDQETKPKIRRTVVRSNVYNLYRIPPMSTVMQGSYVAEDDDEKEEKWPPWLRPLLQAKFFVQCKAHVESHKSECNMFCLDCTSTSLCPVCVSASHKDHRAIQIRRSSYHDVIRVSEIQKHLDINGVQTYIINSARIVFLNERPQTRPGKGVTNTCRACDRSLLDSFSFCSLGCKIAGTSGDPVPRARVESSDTEDSAVKGKGGSFTPLTPPPTASGYRAAKRRKGSPRRSPMGGLHVEY